MSAVKPFLSNFDATSLHSLSNMASSEQPGLLQNLFDRSDDTRKLPSDGRTSTSTHRNAPPSRAMLSISPIRCKGPSSKKPANPTQQLHKTEELTTPVTDGTNLPPLRCPVLSVGSSAYVKNLSNHFVGEETPGYSFGNPLIEAASASLRAEDGTPIKQEADDSEETPNFLDASYLDFPMPNSHVDASAIDESTLDDFSLASNGSFDFDTFPSPETVQVAPVVTDPKGIYAMKAMKMNPSAIKKKVKRPSGQKPSTNTSRFLSTEVTEPTDLDILRGRGGLTNRHPGNMRFRDEARKLRAEVRREFELFH
jgi:hypothetical protein